MPEKDSIIPGEVKPVVRTFALSDIREDKALEVIEGAMHQTLHEIAKEHDTTSRSVYSKFNAKRFCASLEEIIIYAKHEFPECFV